MLFSVAGISATYSERVERYAEVTIYKMPQIECGISNALRKALPEVAERFTIRTTARRFCVA